MQSKSFSAGELARAADVSTDTLRHYERKGVIAQPPRGANGYRRYPATTLDRVLLVRRALGIGLTLDELAKILKVRERGGAPCHEVRRLAAEKLGDVDRRLKELIALRDDLRGILQDWDTRLGKTPKGKRAHLLEALPKEVRSARRSLQFSTNGKREIKRRKR